MSFLSRQTRGILWNQCLLLKSNYKFLLSLLLYVIVISVVPVILNQKFPLESTKFSSSSKSISRRLPEVSVITDDSDIKNLAIKGGISTVCKSTDNFRICNYDSRLYINKSVKSEMLDVSFRLPISYPSYTTAASAAIIYGSAWDQLAHMQKFVGVNHLFNPNGTFPQQIKLVTRIPTNNLVSYPDVFRLNLLLGMMLPGVGTFLAFKLVAFLQDDYDKKLRNNFYLSGLKPFAYWIGNISPYLFLAFLSSLFITIGLGGSMQIPIPRCLFLFGATITYLFNMIVLNVCLFSISERNKSLRGGLTAVTYILLPMILALCYQVVPNLISFNLSVALVILIPPLGYALTVIPIIVTNLPFDLYLWLNVPSPNTIVLLMIISMVSMPLLIFMFRLPRLLMKRGFKRKGLVKSPSRILMKSMSKEDLNEKFEKKIVLAVNNISKIYETSSGTTVALEDISFDVMENEIFAVIGHNGSGKSTLLSIIAGIIESSSGNVSIRSDTVGFCPQENIFYENLTVRNHLHLMAAIRNINVGRESEEAVNLISKQLKIQKLLDSKCGVLSGGEKRKVQISLASIGEPKLIIMDEPTSGMDPSSRRKLWKFIKRTKGISSIVLCTHYMDEADELAERKAFISYGNLKFVGTSSELKQTFKCGYSIKIKGNNCIKEQLMETVFRDTILELGAYNSDENTQEYIVTEGNITDIVLSLEENQEKLGVESFQVRENGLEKIFMDSEVYVNRERAISDKPKDTNGSLIRSLNQSSESPTNWQKFKLLLRFQIRSSFNLKKYGFRIFGSILVFCLIYWIGNVDISSSRTEVNLQDEWLFRQIMRGEKIMYDCTRYKPSLVPDFMIDTLPSKAANITCGIDGSWTINVNSQFYLSDQYSLFIVAKSEATQDYKLRLIDGTEKSNDVVSYVRQLIIMLILGTAIDSLIIRMIGVQLEERKSFKYLLYTYGITVPAFHASTSIRSLIYMFPFFLGIYALINTLFNLKSGLFIVFYIFYFFACQLQSSGMSFIFQEKSQAKSVFSNYSMLILMIGLGLSFASASSGNVMIGVFAEVLTAILCPNNQLMVTVFNGQKEGQTFVVAIATMFGSCILWSGVIFGMEYSHIFRTRYVRCDDRDNVVLENVSKRVVKNLNLKICKDEIFCLLGMNGAGKSTTIKMLISQLNPEKGTVSIFGKIPETDKFEALKYLSYCSQTDEMLMLNETVISHLNFFVSLTTVNKASQDRRVKAFMDSFQLVTVSNTIVRNLSGGSKRKLLSAIAFMNNNALIVLDEPTAGVDASARETMWKAFKSEKQGRSIIVTTHYLREASMSDVIGILKNGSLICKGSEYQILNEYGKGYQFEVNYVDMGEESSAGNLNMAIDPENNVIDAIKNVCPDGIDKLKLEVGNIRFIIKNARIGDILIVLDSLKEKKVITSYRFQQISIEDVFLDLEKVKQDD